MFAPNLDWFYDTPIGQAIAEMKKRPIVFDNINQYRKNITAKRLKARSERKRKNKILKRNKNKHGNI